MEKVDIVPQYLLNVCRIYTNDFFLFFKFIIVICVLPGLRDYPLVLLTTFSFDNKSGFLFLDFFMSQFSVVFWIFCVKKSSRDRGKYYLYVEQGTPLLSKHCQRRVQSIYSVCELSLGLLLIELFSMYHRLQIPPVMVSCYFVPISWPVVLEGFIFSSFPANTAFHQVLYTYTLQGASLHVLVSTNQQIATAQYKALHGQVLFVSVQPQSRQALCIGTAEVGLSQHFCPHPTAITT